MSICSPRTAGAIALALSSSVTFADNFHKGVYVGLNTGAAFVTGNTFSNLTRQPYYQSLIGLGTTNFRDEASSGNFTGGALLGWNFYCDRVFVYGVELTANLYPDRAYQTFWSVGTQYGSRLINFQDSWDLKYSADLDFKPGWFVSESTEFYAIMGVSMAKLETELKNLIGNNQNDVSNIFCDKKNVYGFVLGAGLQTQLTNKVSVFSSYQYTKYRSSSLVDGAEGGGIVNEQNFTDGSDIVDRKLRLQTHLFKLGLIYTF
jgi:opacity protein-like surface antigen